MHIETYSEKYYLDVVEIVENFYHESLHEFNDMYDCKSVMSIIQSVGKTQPGNAFLLIVNDKAQGILAGIEVPNMINGTKVFQELIWYINKPFRRYGVILLKRVQALLKASGFVTMIMAVMENSKTDKIKALYTRMGFKLFECQYIRSL